MEVDAVALVSAAAASAAADWWAVGRRHRRRERWLKPLTMVLLVGVAAVAGSPDPGVRVALVVGAAFGLIGDLALLEDRPGRFLAGLVSFAMGHVAYSVAAVQTHRSAWSLVGASVAAALLGCRFATRIVPGARRLGGRVLAAAVVAYGAVISAMVIAVWGVAGEGGWAWCAPIGAVSFAASDWVLGHVRFAGPLPGGRLTVMVPYHVGQAMLLVGIALA